MNKDKYITGFLGGKGQTKNTCTGKQICKNNTKIQIYSGRSLRNTGDAPNKTER